jgi:glycosyltransferase involved in cell wall biosynthesis
MTYIKKELPNIKLIIIGEGIDDEAIKYEIRKLEMKNYVQHNGWVSHEDKLRYIKYAHIGLIPYAITAHWNTTIPNKIFDYMCMRKPVLCTDIIPCARIIKESKCGLIYEQDNMNDLISKLKELSNEDKRKYFGENGYNKVMEKYNWSNDKKRIFKAIDEVKKL